VNATCAVCGGPIHQRINVAYSSDNQPEGRAWLHLHVEDWRDHPHDAVPVRPAEDPAVSQFVVFTSADGEQMVIDTEEQAPEVTS
jgi:hypothetical protein